MMQRKEEAELATGPWEAFALAAIAPLGPLAHVHLAPRIPPSLLNNALLTYLPLKRDELILALIDRGGWVVGSCCAFTTRRVYWEESASEGRRRSLRGGVKTKDRGPVVLIARYGDLPENIPTSRGEDGLVRLDVGGGRAIVLKGIDLQVGEALARFLETMSAADRRGAAALLLEVEPELAARISRVLPAVARLTAQGLAISEDLVRFRSALHSATKRPVMTPLFIMACAAVFAVMVASGVHALFPSVDDLRDWGATSGARIVVRGEWWRLCTSMFIHGGLIHLALNMWSLMVIGPLVERLYGNVAFAVLYLASGVGGALASVAASPVRIGVGASGAICGVLGALAAFLIAHRRSIPASLLKSLRASVLGVIILMVMLGWIVPNIDQEAHFGGLVTGFASGLALYRPWPVVRSRLFAFRRVVGAMVVTAALLATSYGVARRAVAALPSPSARLEEIRVQLAPSLAELNAISDSLPSSLALKRDRADREANGAQLEAIDALARRAGRNLKRLRRASTPYPVLENLAATLIQAQGEQIAALEASRRYLDTGDLRHLEGSDGLLKMKIAVKRTLESFQQQYIEYKRANDLIPPPQPVPLARPRGLD